MMNYSPFYGYVSPYAQQILNQQQQQIQNTPMRVILISNDDEVKAIPADNNGNPTFYYNKSGQKIFIKQVNPQTMEAHIQSFKAEPSPDQFIKTQPDEFMKYHQTVIEGMNGLYRELHSLKESISTQPPIMTELEETKSVKRGKQSAE